MAHRRMPTRLPLLLATSGVLVLIGVVIVVGVVTRDAAWTAGVAAVATMVVLAYQSWQIRKSTAVAAQSVRISQAGAVEAEKTRLDQRAPAIRVSIGQPGWPPRMARTAVGHESAEVPRDQVFRFPRDEPQRIGLYVEGEATNEGTTTVDVEFHDLRVREEDPTDQDRKPWSEPGTYRRSLEPGGTVHFGLYGERPAFEWAENARARADGRLPPYGIEGKVVVDDGFDNGVIDTRSIEISGTPLVRMPGETEAWKVPTLLLGAPLANPDAGAIPQSIPDRSPDKTAPAHLLALQGPPAGATLARTLMDGRPGTNRSMHPVD